MSVLVKKEDQYFIFVKGAPEKIYENSQNKTSNFNLAIEDLSFEGLRTIAMGYK